MKTCIKYNVCRDNLGADTTEAQFAAYKELVSASIEAAFPHADVTVGESDFANASTCQVLFRGPVEDGDEPITREDVEMAVSDIDDNWWDA